MKRLNAAGSDTGSTGPSHSGELAECGERAILMSTRQQEDVEASASPPRSPESTVLPTEKTSKSIRYRMAEKLAAIGEDVFILNDRGQRVFKVDGKTARLGDTLIFRDMEGTQVCKIQQRTARTRNSMEIGDADDRRIAIVLKTMVTPLRDRFVDKIDNGPSFELEGNILAHEYRIGKVATVSKSWFQVQEAYGVEIIPGQNHALILAATVCVDQMVSDVR
jgi:uncharacterized protein YxjI